MSHGNKNGILYTKDRMIRVEDIWAPFNGNQCKNLVGKPKIFLIQACRGSMQDVGAVYESDDTEIALCSKSTRPTSMKSDKFVVPSMADILIYFSSAEGFPSFREHDGSWFVQALCAAFQSCYDSKIDTDLMELFTHINRAIAFAKQAKTNNDFNACKQMPTIVSMLTKHFMLTFKKE